MRWYLLVVLTMASAFVGHGVDDAFAAKRLVFAETEITGEVQRPQVTVYISRQNLNDRYALDLKESFLPKIIEAVYAPPF